MYKKYISVFFRYQIYVLADNIGIYVNKLTTIFNNINYIFWHKWYSKTENVTKKSFREGGSSMGFIREFAVY